MVKSLEGFEILLEALNLLFSGIVRITLRFDHILSFQMLKMIVDQMIFFDNL
jgi:hypothetical protein